MCVCVLRELVDTKLNCPYIWLNYLLPVGSCGILWDPVGSERGSDSTCCVTTLANQPRDAKGCQVMPRDAKGGILELGHGSLSTEHRAPKLLHGLRYIRGSKWCKLRAEQ